MHEQPHSREALATAYLDQLPFAPYPVQEEALLSWFTTDQGVLVCAPTGTGKTLIAEAAAFEALHTRRVVYYTTPLIALTEQKFAELQARAEAWGFDPCDVGLVTGNRRVNPQARVLVVVAEILVNRLLHREAFDFADVSAVVMDEFHSFADPERGIVWELSLALLPAHVRLLLLSATVGNSREFLAWLKRAHHRQLDLVESEDRRVPLTHAWVGDSLLGEQLARMAQGPADQRFTPALVFCFNREECWTVAEQLKGRDLLPSGQQARLAEELKAFDFSQGVGPKLRQMLLRGVGVHHAGILPKYRRVVEDLFQRKLLSVAVCTETLAAGINLPARSVVLTSLLKGPPGKQKLLEPSVAHQMMGRAGRPQFDTRGYVFVMAHEDDVKILRWKREYDKIPEDTKDPALRKAKKAMKKKMPTRRKTEQYWNEDQFEKLKKSPPGSLVSRGPLTWRLLAYLLQVSPDVDRLRQFVHKRLLPPKRLESAERELESMLLTLWAAGYVRLDQPPPAADEAPSPEPARKQPVLRLGLLGQPLEETTKTDVAAPPRYRPLRAEPTPELARLLVFRSVNPLYGAFLIENFDLADADERLQALESVLEFPSSLAHAVRVPGPDELPAGPLAQQRLDPELLQRGLVTADQLQGAKDEDGEPDERRRLLPLAMKLRMYFDALYPGVTQLRTQPVWVAGELLRFAGDFNKYVTSSNLVKQEGIVFRHLLRLILLCQEFAELTPPTYEPAVWRAELRSLADRLSAACRTVDPQSTDEFIERAAAADVVEGESHAAG